LLEDPGNYGECSVTCRAVALCHALSVNSVISDKITKQREDLQFRVLRLLESRPDASQREISEALSVSLGAINFCLKALIDKGHIKLANFKASKNKLGYVYVLTPEGILHRTQLTTGFIERKLAEFEAIRVELEELRGEFAQQPTTVSGM
jgi:EPS-associated MarR family transcriptional regulator